MNCPEQPPENFAHIGTPLFKSQKKIMVLEDDHHLLELYVRFFEISGYEVSGTTLGSEGEELFLQFKPDLIVVDAAMPGVSGLDFLQNLQNIGIFKENDIEKVKDPKVLPKVLIVTALDSSFINNYPLEKKYPIIHKPFRFESLLEEISKILDLE